MGASGHDALDAAADELYGLPPEEFTSRRGELAKSARAAGDKAAAAEIAKLRKPTVPAWLVNLLSREAADDLSELLALGEELRQAQAQLLGPRMKELSQRASAAVQQLSRRAAELAGARGLAVPAAVDRDVEQTLRAALADPQAEVAVSSGRLTRALAYAGFGEVDVTAATATPLRPGAPRPAAARPAATRPAAPPAGRSAEPAAGESPADQPTPDRQPSAVAEPAADGTTDEEPATGREPAAPRRRSTAGRTPAGRATPSSRTPASTSPHRSTPDHAAAERAAADRLAAARTADEAARAAHDEALRAAQEAADAAQAAEQLVGELQEQLAQARRDAVTAARDAATAKRAEQRAARAAREAAAGLRAVTSSVPQPT